MKNSCLSLFRDYHGWKRKCHIMTYRVVKSKNTLALDCHCWWSPRRKTNIKNWERRGGVSKKKKEKDEGNRRGLEESEEEEENCHWFVGRLLVHCTPLMENTAMVNYSPRGIWLNIYSISTHTHAHTVKDTHFSTSTQTNPHSITVSQNASVTHKTAREPPSSPPIHSRTHTHNLVISYDIHSFHYLHTLTNLSDVKNYTFIHLNNSDYFKSCALTHSFFFQMERELFTSNRIWINPINPFKVPWDKPIKYPQCRLSGQSKLAFILAAFFIQKTSNSKSNCGAYL